MTTMPETVVVGSVVVVVVAIGVHQGIREIEVSSVEDADAEASVTALVVVSAGTDAEEVETAVSGAVSAVVAAVVDVVIRVVVAAARVAISVEISLVGSVWESVPLSVPQLTANKAHMQRRGRILPRGNVM